jgi:hypothetical protein
LQTAFLVGEQRPAQKFQAIRPGESLKDQLPVQLVRRGTLIIAHDLCACGLDQFAIIHAGRARRHAGDATEARVKMADPFFIYFRLPFEGQLHQVDAATRRIHLLAPE